MPRAARQPDAPPPTRPRAGPPSRSRSQPRRDAALARRLEAWFRANRRDLPWRPSDPDAPRDPYRTLVSELMLQQTQAARVAERFGGFIARFPDVVALADADEQDVLALWSGLGYYRRARLLHAAARAVVEDHAARVPDEPEALRRLPGVGRYTAGAVASLAFGVRTPIVDANVARVLLRVEGRDTPPDDPETQKWIWQRSAALVERAASPSVFNEALMELGATVCTPRAPRCGSCPIKGQCHASAEGLQNHIPAPKARTTRRELFCDVARVEDARGRLLVERRTGGGMWDGLWQAPTLERDDRHSSPAEVRAAGVFEGAHQSGEFTHQTTHRVVRFRVWTGTARAGATHPRGEWKSRRAVEGLALSSPQRRILLGG